MKYKAWRAEVKRRFKAQTGLSIPRQDSFEYRDLRLKHAGFLEWERRYLAVHKISTPATTAVIERRRRDLVDFVRARGYSIGPNQGCPFPLFNEWQRKIAKDYRDHNWRFTDGRLNPFKMRDAIRQEEDEDETPQPKKRRPPTKDFHDHKERTMRQQENRLW